MRISERQYVELLEAFTFEGDRDLLIGPLASIPADVPPAWVAPLSSPDPRAAVAVLWQPLADRIPRIYRALRERLRGVALVQVDGAATELLYLFSDGDDCIPFRGGSPLPSAATAGTLPGEFLDLYQIHDGWIHHYSKDGGPLPMAAWAPLAGLWPDVSWSLPPGVVSPEGLTAVYRDGDDLALAYDTGTFPPLPFRCYGDGSVDVLLDMWAAIDRGTGSFLEDLDLAEDSDGPMDQAVIDQGRKAVSRYEQVLARIPEREVLAAHLGGGAIHDQACDMLLECALLERLGRGPRGKIVEYYRRALLHWCAGIELGGDSSAIEALDWFGVAQALGDVPTAHFIATLPTAIWADDSPETLQARIVFCLYLGVLEHATVFAEELSGLTFDGDDSPDPEAEITARLLEGLTQMDASLYGVSRERAVAELCRTPTDHRQQIPWTFRLQGLDAVASKLGLLPNARR